MIENLKPFEIKELEVQKKVPNFENLKPVEIKNEELSEKIKEQNFKVEPKSDE